MSAELVRLSVNLNRETADALTSLAQQRGITMTEAIRRGIAVLKFVYEQQAAGRQIITMDADGSNKQEMVMM